MWLQAIDILIFCSLYTDYMCFRYSIFTWEWKWHEGERRFWSCATQALPPWW